MFLEMNVITFITNTTFHPPYPLFGRNWGRSEANNVDTELLEYIVSNYGCIQISGV